MKKAIKSTHGVVRFSLKDSYISLQREPEKESLIMLHFSMGGRRFKKSTGYKSSFQNWDTRKQRISTRKGQIGNAFEINNYLGNLQSFVEKEYSIMSQKDSGVRLNILKEKVGGYIKGITHEDIGELQNLVDYAEKLILSKANSIAKTTYRSYNQTITLLKLYETRTGTKLTFDDIDLRFYRNFCEMMEEEEYALNSIGKHIKSLKTFMNDALINGVTKNMRFKNQGFKILKEVTTQIYLNEDELATLEQKDISKYPSLQHARDIFLIGCYTGQRVSDYNGLSNKDIVEFEGHNYIKIEQGKTRNIVHIPITNKIRAVMARYEGCFPPKMSEPMLRENLKEAAQMAGLVKDVEVSFTRGGKPQLECLPQYKLVKTHTARRTFCTNHYMRGKPIQDIMEFSGHKTEKEFYKYIRVQKEQKAVAIFKSGFFD